MTAALITLNIVLSASVITTIVGSLIWSIATQQRDHRPTPVAAARHSEQEVIHPASIATACATTA